MSETGFLAQRRRSPTGFTLVVAAHVAALGALALAKTPVFERIRMTPIDTYWVPPLQDPPPVPDPQPQTRQQQSRPTALPTRVPDPTGPVIGDPPEPTVTFDPGPIGPVVIADAGPVVTHTPIRRAAVMLSRDLQPPYPPSEQRAERSGRVEIRVTIGPDGRVTAVERLFATSDAFWQATQRQALSRWRFRPATEDGRPVAGTKVLTVTFRIEDLEV